MLGPSRCAWGLPPPPSALEDSSSRRVRRPCAHVGSVQEALKRQSTRAVSFSGTLGSSLDDGPVPSALEHLPPCTEISWAALPPSHLGAVSSPPGPQEMRRAVTRARRWRVMRAARQLKLEGSCQSHSAWMCCAGRARREAGTRTSKSTHQGCLFAGYSLNKPRSQ